jgi:hypothetical protein
LKTRSRGLTKSWRQIDAFSIFIAALMLFGKPWHVRPPQTSVSAHEGDAWVGGDVWVYGAVRIRAGDEVVAGNAVIRDSMRVPMRLC